MELADIFLWILKRVRIYMYQHMNAELLFCLNTHTVWLQTLYVIFSVVKSMIFRSYQPLPTATIKMHLTESKTLKKKWKQSRIIINHCTFSVSISLNIIQDRWCIIVECVDWTVRLRGILVLYIQHMEKHTFEDVFFLSISIILNIQPLLICWRTE